MLRDSQRSRVYRSERAAGLWETEKVQDWQGFLVRLFDNELGSGNWSIRFTLKRRNARCSSAWPWLLAFAPHHTIKGVLVHEAAHCITHRRHPQDPGHGPWFCMVYLDLAEKYVGREFADRLRASFYLNRVSFRGGLS